MRGKFLTGLFTRGGHCWHFPRPVGRQREGILVGEVSETKVFEYYSDDSVPCLRDSVGGEDGRELEKSASAKYNFVKDESGKSRDCE